MHLQHYAEVSHTGSDILCSRHSPITNLQGSATTSRPYARGTDPPVAGVHPHVKKGCQATVLVRYQQLCMARAVHAYCQQPQHHAARKAAGVAGICKGQPGELENEVPARRRGGVGKEAQYRVQYRYWGQGPNLSTCQQAKGS
jgi:hypothetical protein